MGRGKELSKFIPFHTNDPNFDHTEDTPQTGGEFVIPLDEEMIFWVKIPGSNKQVGGPSFNGPQVDVTDFSSNMQIEFGTEVPNDTAPTSENGKYFFYMPIFKIKVMNTEVLLERYEVGECVYISSDFEGEGNYLNFSRVSSYFDV